MSHYFLLKPHDTIDYHYRYEIVQWGDEKTLLTDEQIQEFNATLTNYKGKVSQAIDNLPKPPNKDLDDEDKENLIIANISLKYAQSNNVAFAFDGQLVGLAAGQQNRVDCVKLAGQKTKKWFL